uniref:EC52 protein n=1 Tax=Colletotrichum higginsianum TaxID=80884 RepID=I2G7D2_9PEZI|nr:EC52 protein [Colletotrichum higginsianum]
MQRFLPKIFPQDTLICSFLLLFPLHQSLTIHTFLVTQRGKKLDENESRYHRYLSEGISYTSGTGPELYAMPGAGVCWSGCCGLDPESVGHEP